MQGKPLEVSPGIEYASGEVKGALNVCEPPHELVTVKVPVAGGLLKVKFPERVYRLVDGLQAPGVLVALNEQKTGTTQATGAVYDEVAVHDELSEKDAVTVHDKPFDVNPVIEYACGEVKGALKVCEPPQELVTVKVPVVGGLLNVKVPERLYWLVDGLHALGALVAPNEQNTGETQLTGAV